MHEIAITLITLGALMMLGLVRLGVPVEIALLLAGIATATAPAATADVVHETGAQGPFSRTLIGIVAVGDAWGLIAFSLMLAAVHLINGDGGMADVMLVSLWELGGALCRDDPAQRWWMGLAMLPQAGVALGMALVAMQRLPALGKIILPVVVGATVMFELIGPVLTRLALQRVGEAPKTAGSANGGH